MTAFTTIFITAMIFWTAIILYIVSLDKKLRRLSEKISQLDAISGIDND
ncbi:MAG: CcmD family protein [Methanosarcinaceae archaeon]|nr:CcmD family protein [Methanosarcinaceae archaeon]